MHFVWFISVFLYVLKDSYQMNPLKIMREEDAPRTIYKSTSTGNIVINEVNPEGKFIVLENISSGPDKMDVNLAGWKLKRSIDGKRDYIYNIGNFGLKTGKRVKIFARGSASMAGPKDLIFREEDTWGVGLQATTSLVNDKNKEEATYVQKTVYN